MRSALAVACLASFAAFALAGDAPVAPQPATKHYESEDRRVGFDLPADWTATAQPAGQWAYKLSFSGPAGGGIIEVYHLPGFRDVRAQAFLERETLHERYDGDPRGDVTLSPMPHLVMDRTDGNNYVRHAWIYRVIERNGFTMAIYCNPPTWDAAKDALFAAAKSMTSSVAEWPARPAGYAASERDGYQYLVQPGVKDADVATLHKEVLDFEKAYAKVHGPVPKPAGNRPVVVVNADRSAAAKVWTPQAGDDSDYYTDILGGRLVCVAARKFDAGLRARFAIAAVGLFHAQTYGYCASWWMCRGEMLLANAEAATGKPLPTVPDGFVERQMPRSVDALEKFLRHPNAPADQSTAYVALFRAGAKPWRDAFAAFLAELSATGDWITAEKKHLLSLDQEKLRAAAQAFLKELKPAKAK